MDVLPDVRRWSRRSVRGVVSGGLGILLTTIGAGAVAAPAFATGGEQPPGADGSVKIDETPVDSDPSNEPHVDCGFGLQHFGFDEGQNAAEVTFYAWPSTGDKDTLTLIEGRSEFTFDGGRPTGNTLNHTEMYELDTEGLEPNQKGEVHIKVDVTVTDAGGKTAFHKYKVFWVEQCAQATPSPSPSVPDETATPTASPEPTESDDSDETPQPGPTRFEGGGFAGSDSAGSSGPGIANAGWILLFGGLAAVAVLGARAAGRLLRQGRGA